ncbi:hypothetical protein P3X46_014477 [Hevea brasiliensis]|uniref:Sororin C-terminal region domain-containing protein n=1 Tax=Hevea brasiliensis TaxID=3981 RepID=A0ABQ9M6T4_HEVBR|nr:uncharacterized protein LOC110668102 isoform X1 [Hevea brasiliensis]KAJ9175982.1 hypothetical protein P3X46_014477 [Hevea brasiliensis]
MRMEAKRSRRSSRKPLSDCTNSINPSQSSSTSAKNSSSIIKPSKFSPTTTETQKKSTTGCTTRNDNALLNPSTVSLPTASTPPRAQKPSSLAGTPSHKVSEPCSVYSRRLSVDKRKSKGKAVAVPMSCFPAVKTQFARDEMNEGGVAKLSKSCTVPCKKKRCQTEKDIANYALPQDFIEQQRAYFAEIDAFELSEEEVTSVDDLD